MNPRTPFAEIRRLIARDELPAAMKTMRELLENTSQLDEVLHQSGRFENIRRQIRLGTLDQVLATVEQNRIRAALLELLKEIEIQVEQPALRTEMEHAISIVISKNVVEGSTITADGNIQIGDTTSQQAEKIYNNKKIGAAFFDGVHVHYGERKIPRNLTLPPFDPPVFLGREEELQTVHDRLFGGQATASLHG